MCDIEKYQDWIWETYGDSSGYGKCDSRTLEMQKVFPELQRVRGHYWCLSWGRRTHWWLKTADGAVVDPSANQFPSKGTGFYEEHDESQPEPTGRCLNCGEYIFGLDTFCSPACQLETRSDMGI